MPVMKSISGTGTRSGGPSRSPVSCIRPIVAWRLGSIARPRPGPCPVIEHQTRRSGMSAGPKSSRSGAFSITTSACSARRRASPASTTALRLPRLRAWKNALSPSGANGRNARPSSPLGDSTLTTSAPRSLSVSPKKGPASSGAGGGVALGGTLAQLRRLDLAVLRRRGRHERVEQPRRDLDDLVDRAIEGFLIRLRGLRRAADLAHVLERRGADLLLGGGWLEVVKGADVAAHAYEVTPGRPGWWYASDSEALDRTRPDRRRPADGRRGPRGHEQGGGPDRAVQVPPRQRPRPEPRRQDDPDRQLPSGRRADDERPLPLDPVGRPRQERRPHRPRRDQEEVPRRQAGQALPAAQRPQDRPGRPDHPDAGRERRHRDGAGRPHRLRIGHTGARN